MGVMVCSSASSSVVETIHAWLCGSRSGKAIAGKGKARALRRALSSHACTSVKGTGGAIVPVRAVGSIVRAIARIRWRRDVPAHRSGRGGVGIAVRRSETWGLVDVLRHGRCWSATVDHRGLGPSSHGWTTVRMIMVIVDAVHRR